jgi:Xaa-Pro aminopeptidase
MWKNGMDYKCGTGHGVGYFLSVHEGPHGFRQTHSPVKLVPGMIITNEPGVYRAGRLGVRTENTMLVVPALQTEDGTFYKFETISCCPIDVKTLDLGRLSLPEKQWLDEYHLFVFNQVSPHLDENEQEWLRKATKAIACMA